MSGTTGIGNIGSQVSTALQGTMDSAAIARLVQQLLTAQNSAQQATGTTGTQQQAGSVGTAGVQAGQQQGTTTGTTGTDVSNSGLQANDYATMMQQMLALLYGRGSSSSGSGGTSNGSTSS